MSWSPCLDNPGAVWTLDSYFDRVFEPKTERSKPAQRSPREDLEREGFRDVQVLGDLIVTGVR